METVSSYRLTKRNAHINRKDRVHRPHQYGYLTTEFLTTVFVYLTKTELTVLGKEVISTQEEKFVLHYDELK